MWSLILNARVVGYVACDVSFDTMKSEISTGGVWQSNYVRKSH